MGPVFRGAIGHSATLALFGNLLPYLPGPFDGRALPLTFFYGARFRSPVLVGHWQSLAFPCVGGPQLLSHPFNVQPFSLSQPTWPVAALPLPFFMLQDAKPQVWHFHCA